MRFDKIDETLNTTSETVDIQPIVEESAVTKPSENKDVQKDYEYTRGNLYSLIEKGQETLNGIMDLADQTQSPRAYEVAGQIIKSVADTTDKLLDLQKKLKDIDDEKKGPTSVTNNAMFVGSTAELQKMLKEMNKNSK
nr:terminase DNA packaging enzyme small subunit [uncultured Mediterranean phage uvMED]